MKYGLKQDTLNQINSVFKNYEVLTKVILYGSRAKGNFRANSDIDLVCQGKDLNLNVLNQIAWDLDDLLLPYTFDISIYRHIKQNDLLEHIERVGLVLYQKKQASQK